LIADDTKTEYFSHADGGIRWTSLATANQNSSLFTHWRSYDAQTIAYVYRLSYFRQSRTQINTESENLYYMNSANTFYSLRRQKYASIIETETKNQVLKMFENAYM